jgi:hypothetical protein
MPILASFEAVGGCRPKLSRFSKAGFHQFVGQLTKQLSITCPQARGGAGALFALAKSRLSADEFGKVSAAVPGMNGLLKAAPAPSESSELSSLESPVPSPAILDVFFCGTTATDLYGMFTGTIDPTALEIKLHSPVLLMEEKVYA